MNEETNTPEPLAAILAEMRDERIIRLGDADVTRCILLNLADRIEAAAEREMAKGMSKKLDENRAITGNAAALRETLEKIRREYCDGLISCQTCVSSDADVERVSRLFYEKIDAALAAPARNCDRFATVDEARKAFQEVRGHKVIADVELWDSMDEAGAFVRWLFNTAEGGAE